ncbi:hypothetical protein ACFPL7_00055 [Dongia soli]|uniref:Uncharacterized protein n=1 Tax=Dongia soli TaxID=600628 RepID=A0ABU5ELP5_9PROT|nr:hypothetical protein [Dongia soli]MDY0885876.1 hypothetical protein [Dongia soli]
MTKMIRLVLATLFAVSFMLGSLGGAASAQSVGLVADLPCHMIAGQADPGSKPMAPCKGLKTDCVNQTGCVSINAMMAQPFGHQIDMQYVAEPDYLPVVNALPSFILVPEPLPPRTI